MRLTDAQVEAQKAAIAKANAFLQEAGLPEYLELANKQAMLAIKANRPVIQIQVRTVYGNEQAYPANKAAEILAGLAGTKTLGRNTLAKIQELGYVVEQVAQPAFMPA